MSNKNHELSNTPLKTTDVKNKTIFNRKQKNHFLLFALFFFFLIFLYTKLISKQFQTVNFSKSEIGTENSDNSIKEKLIEVKYRDNPVNINSINFEHVSVSSSFVNEVWYDKKNEYMIIQLNDTYYHYCGFPTSKWLSFKEATSFGSYYNENIKGHFDCRKGNVPNY